MLPEGLCVAGMGWEGSDRVGPLARSGFHSSGLPEP